ncbi:hypothetical protein [Haladaptatus sp. DYSN1]|uniref:hypothetical protein n=1 Tax=unclassified Haladaptatus TaxID=2622732 RepID=UPI0024062A44|nr:hypothetical protein [Haladaptatus sp. DYSN1]
MATATVPETIQTKRRLVYGAMVLAGILFVSTLVLPVPQATAQLIAALAFGVMSGLWLAHLLYSL